jgi:hypothetical protein
VGWEGKQKADVMACSPRRLASCITDEMSTFCGLQAVQGGDPSPVQASNGSAAEAVSPAATENYELQIRRSFSGASVLRVEEGQRVEVEWTDGTWYAGSVTSAVDSASELCTVLFDDGVSSEGRLTEENAFLPAPSEQRDRDRWKWVLVCDPNEANLLPARVLGERGADRVRVQFAGYSARWDLTVQQKSPHHDAALTDLRVHVLPPTPLNKLQLAGLRKSVAQAERSAACRAARELIGRWAAYPNAEFTNTVTWEVLDMAVRQGSEVSFGPFEPWLWVAPSGVDVAIDGRGRKIVAKWIEPSDPLYQLISVSGQAPVSDPATCVSSRKRRVPQRYGGAAEPSPSTSTAGSSSGGGGGVAPLHSLGGALKADDEPTACTAAQRKQIDERGERGLMSRFGISRLPGTTWQTSKADKDSEKEWRHVGFKDLRRVAPARLGSLATFDRYSAAKGHAVRPFTPQHTYHSRLFRFSHHSHWSGWNCPGALRLQGDALPACVQLV